VKINISADAQLEIQNIKPINSSSPTVYKFYEAISLQHGPTPILFARSTMYKIVEYPTAGIIAALKFEPYIIR
jgi:hypothetical protein